MEGPTLTTGRAALFASEEAFEAPRRRSRRPWDEALFSVDGTRPWGGGWPSLTSLSALPQLQRLSFFLLSLFSPLVPQHFFVLRGAVSCWNSFHNKLKNPAVALDAARKAAGFLRADSYRGSSSAAKVGPLCEIQSQLSSGAGASAHGG